MTSSEVWDAETAAHYDRSAAAMFVPEVLDPTVALLARLAGPGPVLEMAIGTGRVAIPLAARGLAVSGIELSPAMVDQLRRKVGPAELPVVVGDMATARCPGQFSLVYLVWNSISNVRTQDAQVEVFANAARHLAPGGRFLVELWIPPLRRLPPGQLAAPFDVSDDHLGIDTYDLASQQCASHHYWHDEDGTIRYDVGHFRYIWPAECDLMARLAGLALEERMSDWDGGRFTSDSERHISVWRKP